MLKEYAAKRALDVALASLREYISRHLGSISPTDDIAAAVAHHMEYVSRWCDALSFGDVTGRKALGDVFIELDTYVFPRSSRISETEVVEKHALLSMIDKSTTHTVVLGHPGAGKTTSIKQIAQRILTSDQFIQSAEMPLLVELRGLNSSASGIVDPLFAHLALLLGLAISVPDGLGERERLVLVKNVRERAVVGVLKGLGAILLIDGFDELAYGVRQAVFEDLHKLATMLPPGALVITSRTGEFDYQLPFTSTVEVAPLGHAQILEFSRKWLGTAEADTFVDAVKLTPFYDTSMRPLTLAYLCAIYERHHSIPDRPKTVYKHVVMMLIDEWDHKRGLSRQSRFAGFSSDMKFDLLCELSFAMGPAARFNQAQLLRTFATISRNHGLDVVDGAPIISEIESHTGLLVRSGVDTYEYAHKSLQEYLAAEYIVKLASVPARGVLVGRQSETAVTIAISADPSGYLAEVVLRRLLGGRVPEEYWHALASRLASERPEFRSDAHGALATAILYSEVFRVSSADSPLRDVLLFLAATLRIHLKVDGALLLNGLYTRTSPRSEVRELAPAEYTKTTKSSKIDFYTLTYDVPATLLPEKIFMPIDLSRFVHRDSDDS